MEIYKNILRKSAAIILCCFAEKDTPMRLSMISRKTAMSYAHVVKIIFDNKDIFTSETKGRMFLVSLTNKGLKAAEYLSLAVDSLK